MYQPSTRRSISAGSKSTLEDWQRNVSRLCAGSSRLMFSLSAALAAPLIKLVDAESGGFHFRGPSSIGKTTALITAGSVWGGGGSRGYIQTWRATDNGLEAVALAHCDRLLCLDELSQVAPEAAGEAAYMLANGQGKHRAAKDGSGRRPNEWANPLLSTGEIGLEDKLRESKYGKRFTAGQQVRIIDVPADAGARTRHLCPGARAAAGRRTGGSDPSESTTGGCTGPGGITGSPRSRIPCHRPTTATITARRVGMVAAASPRPAFRTRVGPAVGTGPAMTATAGTVTGITGVAATGTARAPGRRAGHGWRTPQRGSRRRRPAGRRAAGEPAGWRSVRSGTARRGTARRGGDRRGTARRGGDRRGAVGSGQPGADQSGSGRPDADQPGTGAAGRGPDRTLCCVDAPAPRRHPFARHGFVVVRYRPGIDLGTVVDGRDDSRRPCAAQP